MTACVGLGQCGVTSPCRRHREEALSHPTVLRAVAAARKAMEYLEAAQLEHDRITGLANAWQLHCLSQPEDITKPHDYGSGREEWQHHLWDWAAGELGAVKRRREDLALLLKELSIVICDVAWSLSPRGRRAAEESADAAGDLGRVDSIRYAEDDRAFADAEQERQVSTGHVG